MNNLNKPFQALAVLGLTLALTACGDSRMSDLREFVDTAYSDRKPEIEPLPEMRPFKAYEYSAYDLDDPFDIGNVFVGRDGGGADTTGLRPDETRAREPLEFFPLDALKMMGTLERDNKPWVILQTSQGTAHYLAIGNYMGQNEGQIKVIDVAQQAIVLTETFLNTSGQWETRDVELTIEE
ncbi:MAG: pilus assembly protein PilP [Arenicella sp.]|nr:pilus assembly protein PilP [Arenicella sp.]